MMLLRPRQQVTLNRCCRSCRIKDIFAREFKRSAVSCVLPSSSSTILTSEHYALSGSLELYLVELLRFCAFGELVRVYSLACLGQRS